MEKEPIAKAPRGRQSRTPIGKRNVLTVTGKEPGYVYRVVNDRGDRIAAFEDAGYELVDASAVRVGDKRVNKTSAPGTKAEVSVGQGDKAYVMRIREEWYKEDQQAKATEVNRQEETIKQLASKEGAYGTITIERK